MARIIARGVVAGPSLEVLTPPVSAKRHEGGRRGSIDVVVGHSSGALRAGYQCAEFLLGFHREVRVAAVDSMRHPPWTSPRRTPRTLLILVLETSWDGLLPGFAVSWLRRPRAPRLAAAAICGLGAGAVRAVPNVGTLELWFCLAGTPIVAPTLQLPALDDVLFPAWCGELAARAINRSEALSSFDG